MTALRPRGPTRVLIGLVSLYRATLSPVLGTRCRFEPSCSAYAAQALASHGALRGLWLTARRLLRCHPLCAGGYDPVPPPASSIAGRRGHPTAERICGARCDAVAGCRE